MSIETEGPLTPEEIAGLREMLASRGAGWEVWRAYFNGMRNVPASDIIDRNIAQEGSMIATSTGPKPLYAEGEGK